MRKTIVGIDPGTNILGFAVIETAGTRLKLIEMDVLRMHRSDTHHGKLKEIFLGLQILMKKYRPHELAIEAPFFGKNVQSMLKLGRAQGVAITVALSMDIPVFEYSPRKIKQAITGHGNASKEQVAAVLSQLMLFERKFLLHDATDALGAAVCHSFQQTAIHHRSAGAGSWKKFIAQNPQRIVPRQKGTV